MSPGARPLIAALSVACGLLIQTASAAQAPYAETFDSYPDGGVPANFVERTDANWAVRNKDGTGSYEGTLFAPGTTLSSYTSIDLSNVAGRNFTFTTNFTATASVDQSKVVELGFTALSAYHLTWRVSPSGSPYTGEIILEGQGRRINSVNYPGIMPLGSGEYTVTMHGGYVDGTLYLTGALSNRNRTLSLRIADPAPAIGSEFGYNQLARSLPGRFTAVTAFYDDFSVIFETLPVRLGNLSTRLSVRQGEEVAIAGLIVTGNSPKRICVRGRDANLGAVDQFDPVLELLRADGTRVAFNDNWRDTQELEIFNASMWSHDDQDSILIATLEPGAYTALLREKKNTLGRGSVEVYDLTPGSSGPGNISTRGWVGTGDDAMIGGVIASGDGKARVIIRALGPSLREAGITQPLADPTLELRNRNGQLVKANDNWRDTQEAEILGTSLAPTYESEAAIVADLLPTDYTAIVRGKNDTTGVALVEVYNLN
jgi:hypothetical protein